eukprot:gene18408-biopygen20443
MFITQHNFEPLCTRSFRTINPAARLWGGPARALAAPVPSLEFGGCPRQGVRFPCAVTRRAGRNDSRRVMDACRTRGETRACSAAFSLRSRRCTASRGTPPQRERAGRPRRQPAR